MLLHPRLLFAALRGARAQRASAVEASADAAERATTLCKTISRKAAAKCEQRESAEWNGPWLIAKPLDMGQTRGGSSLPDA